MNIIAKRREKKLLPKIVKLREFYEAEENSEIWQLKQLNRLWEGYIQNLPIVASAVQSGQYPSRFSSLKEFVETVPSIGRRDFAERLQECSIAEPAPDAFRTTGGSTSEPISLPAWKREFEETSASQWLGRAWQGVRPSDRLFLLWGHAHLLGSGLRGKLNGYKRQVFDSLLGYCRASAYNLSETALKEAGDRLLKFKPDYVYGYSVALDQLARANQWRRAELHQLKLKCIQATAERFPAEESRSLIEDVFGCPVVMEYGAMETGHLAATAPNGSGYQVYWRDYILEGVKQVDGSHKILVTSLFPRATPLIRYELGDSIQLESDCANDDHVIGIKKFIDVGGRCNYGIRLADGTFFHSEVFTHCVRDLKVIVAFQVIHSGDVISVDYIGGRDLTEDEIASARKRFEKVDKRLGGIPFNRVPELQKNTAGKTQMIISKKEAADTL
jgi:phenylacetate-coenzyme A ligase PaaK-like adenylate-forming protein